MLVVVQQSIRLMETIQVRKIHLDNHILSWVCLVLGLISFAAGLSLIDSTNGVAVLVIGVIIGGILLIASLVLFIINIVKGIKLLMI